MLTSSWKLYRDRVLLRPCRPYGRQLVDFRHQHTADDLCVLRQDVRCPQRRPTDAMHAFRDTRVLVRDAVSGVKGARLRIG